MTARSSEALPAFDRPPVTEVAIGLQFDPIDDLRFPQLSRLWDRFRDRYSEIDQQAPLAPVFEELGPGKWVVPVPQVTVSQEAPVPRILLYGKGRTRLVQVQQDRFVHNWRRTSDADSYPHYENLRKGFLREFRLFRKFLSDEGLPTPIGNQCEVAYVNPIPRDGMWERHGQLDRVVTVWKKSFSDSFLKEPQDVRFLERHIISGVDGRPVARLHISVDPVYQTDTGEPVILLQMVARGSPVGGSLKDALALFDLEHEWIVRAFASVTTRQMHSLWGRSDD